ncbi:MAG: isochorismatase family protein [Bauldia sp.]
MPVTTLDPKAALIVIDLQKGIVGMPLASPIAPVIERSARLANAFRERGLPVVLVNVSGRAPGRTGLQRVFSPPPGWDELVPELGAQPGDFRVTKQQIGAFYGTPLELILRRNGVTQVFLTGVATSSGVEATARAAYDFGFHVVSVVDAMTDGDPEAHRHSTEKQLPKIGETASTDEVLAVLAKGAAR